MFIASLGLIFHAYLGYPLSLFLISLFRRKPVRKSPYFPSATMIITAHNEEKRIAQKLENTLKVQYPRDRLQILVASDGSNDRTNEIVMNYAGKGIELLEMRQRKGKENAQKEAVGNSRGEVIVFTDAATLLEPDGLKEILSNFADPEVGCVSCEDRLISKNGKPSGEGSYLAYELWLRRMEYRVNSLVGVSGCFFAARREVCRDFSGEMQSDFRTVLQSRKFGLRGVADPQVIGTYQDVAEEKDEFQRKIRTVIRGLTVFFRNLEFLNIRAYGFFAYQYFCHKLLRWLVPFCLLFAFTSNLILAWNSSLFRVLLLGQLSLYALACWAWRRGSSSNFLLKIPGYFLAVNASILVAWCKYLKGERVIMWNPSDR